MSGLFSHAATKRYLDFPEEKVSLERIRRQRILSGELLSWFTPKHYPRIFLDRRLRSRLFK